ncbi:5-amino-6-(5-phosphoribosylamino)uracil reductase [Kluyveromyces marxianus]|uniref:2,5-diamino-6-ribosylamino-4(3H)-pyrimidinone 5'-phosphate reductase n=2 Tax=Kluyveromyces marxianus TaxID=4911 RepID=W0TDQ2_KLUMD|nr:5-amino-6-(5-phosphoribosylamino)uracil reductase [Kluyveromyces marxianus DMKU3-1042]QGN15981.1 5-amino-6-(5-phosphoribosylamino)uracil reductase [Kluyveromyces marxianus]BAO40249.1 5-amino-6-(5-phosphoribosylamino)uracil reductase [Kluyveromyces marxianus DMKU3-1042]BAP71739.1 5-amino-6-(5-phosphoribosylamino)uracil reductase [Kluyveromyces marxianus]
MVLLPLKKDLVPFLEPYLPDEERDADKEKPYVILTYAQSLDSRIAKIKGTRTFISHEETKTMTHYLRYKFDAIMLGCGTVLVDDPGLNCKWWPEDEKPEHLAGISPRPIILDPNCKWKFADSKMKKLYEAGDGKAPIIVVKELPSEPEEGVDYLVMRTNFTGKMDWSDMLVQLKSKFNVKSVMVEGGGIVINDLLQRPNLVDALIITLGATFLGSEGVEVSPLVEIKLKDVSWWTGDLDTVLCSRLVTH